MRMTPAISLGASVALGLAATYLAWQMTKSEPNADPEVTEISLPVENEVSVVVASAIIVRGDAVTVDNVTVERWPESKAPYGYFTHEQKIAGAPDLGAESDFADIIARGLNEPHFQQDLRGKLDIQGIDGQARGVAFNHGHAALEGAPPMASWKWPNVEMTTALSAVVVGVAALFIAIDQSRIASRQAEIMEQTVQASVWPVVQFDVATGQDIRTARATLSLRNSGVGPALIKGIQISKDGAPVANVEAYLERRVEVTQGMRFTLDASRVTGRVLSASETVLLGEADWDLVVGQIPSGMH